MANDPNPRVLWAEAHSSLRRQRHLHGQVVLEGLRRYGISGNIVIPVSLAKHIHKRLGELLSDERID